MNLNKINEVVNFINKLGFDCNKLMMELRIIEKEDMQLRKLVKDKKYNKNGDNK